jgi:hypothetical protein
MMSELPNVMSELPNVMSELPNVILELPNVILELPNVMSELPKELGRSLNDPFYSPACNIWPTQIAKQSRYHSEVLSLLPNNPMHTQKY